MRPRVLVRTLVIACSISLLTFPALAKRKDDVVVMKNGDRFTGEIKRLKYGELTFKATYMSSAVDLNWDEIQAIESKDAFIVALVNGGRTTGLISMSHEGQHGTTVQITRDASTTQVPQDEVFEIKQAENAFLNQLAGSADLGFSISNGDQSADYMAAFTFGYGSRQDEYSLTGSSDFSRNEDEGTARHNLRFVHTHRFKQRWFTAGIGDFLHSEQQELSLRSTFAAGIGRILYETDHTRISTIGGMAYTHEDYSRNAPGEQQQRSNAEALAGLTIRTFRFKTLAITSGVSVYPSLNDPGRVRFVTDGDLKIELVRNLYWRFHVYENFDNKPPVNAPRNDFGTSSSLGWSF